MNGFGLIVQWYEKLSFPNLGTGSPNFGVVIGMISPVRLLYTDLAKPAYRFFLLPMVNKTILSIVVVACFLSKRLYLTSTGD
ncbi:MAG: hypothetical protein WAT79_00395 [Saprospiraceae bacterium]